jgi:hypothetical protein
MACGKFTVSKVPASKLTQVIDLFKANTPPPTTAPTSNEDKVTAVFAPCPYSLQAATSRNENPADKQSPRQ